VHAHAEGRALVRERGKEGERKTNKDRAHAHGW